MSYSEILMKGIVLFDNQMFIEAIKQFDKAILLNKNDDEAFFCKANCLCINCCCDWIVGFCCFLVSPSRAPHQTVRHRGA